MEIVEQTKIELDGLYEMGLVDMDEYREELELAGNLAAALIEVIRRTDGQ